MRRLMAQVLVADSAVVTTTGFKDPIVKGSLAITLEVLNDWQLDEIIVTAIDGDIEMLCSSLSSAAKYCRTPICAGGGIRCIEDVKNLLSSGADRIHLSKIIREKKWDTISKIVKYTGGQAVVWKIEYREDQKVRYTNQDLKNTSRKKRKT